MGDVSLSAHVRVIRRKVGLNYERRRVGETHQNAKLTDAEVKAIRDLHEFENFGYRRLARRFRVARATIQKICNYVRREQVVRAWKRIEVEVFDNGIQRERIAEAAGRDQGAGDGACAARDPQQCKPPQGVQDPG